MGLMHGKMAVQGSSCRGYLGLWTRGYVGWTDFVFLHLGPRYWTQPRRPLLVPSSLAFYYTLGVEVGTVLSSTGEQRGAVE